MNRFIERFQEVSPTKQFLLVRTFYDWALYVLSTFYITFIFKESGELLQVINNIGVTLVAVFAGFVLGAYVMKHIGVEKTFRFSFLLLIIVGIVGIYLASRGVIPFLLISVIRGLAEGVFWIAANFVELVGLSSISRGKFYSISEGLYGLFNIIMPIILGYLLTKFDSFLPIFAIFTVICILAIFIPYNFKIINKISIDINKFIKFFTLYGVGSFVYVKSSLASIWMIDWLLTSIIPFVILGSELNMGIFLTVSAIIGIVLSFVTHRWKIKKKLSLAKPFLYIAGLFDFIFVVVFSPVMLYINEMVYFNNLSGNNSIGIRLIYKNF